MANKDLFAQAIADAKKLKEISLANAKQSIEEAFAPRIQEMFRMKLSELEEEPEMDEAFQESATEGIDEYGDEHPVSTKDALKKDEGIDEVTLDEILAELELEEGSYEEEEEAKVEEAKKEDEKEEETEKDENEEGTKETPEEDATEGSEELGDLTVDQFIDLVKTAVADILASQSAGTGEEGNLEDKIPADSPIGGAEDLGGEESIDLDEILAELEGDQPGYEAGKQTPEIEEAKKEEEESKVEEGTDLEEAITTIQTLRSELQEINLLNAKLLYANKLFRAKPLSEAQKVRVVAAFDRATTIAEAKNLYATLNDSLVATPTSTKKTPIKESLGFASKPIGTAPAAPIVEADAYVYRMQQLAGIKPQNV